MQYVKIMRHELNSGSISHPARKNKRLNYVYFAIIQTVMQIVIASFHGGAIARTIPGTSLTPNVWWDANAANNILSGDSVAQLTDQSGNANNAIVSSSTAPILVTNDINGLSAMFFGGNSALVSPTGVGQGNTSHTIFVVAKYIPGNSSGYRCGAAFYSGSAAMNANSSIGVDPSTGNPWVGGYGQDSAPYLGASPVANNQFMIYAKVYNSIGQTYTGYINTNTVVAVTAGGASYNLGNSDVGIGRQYDNGGYWSGDIAEVIMFNSALSQSGVSAVENYLNAKYVAAPSDLTIKVIAGNTVQLSWVSPNVAYELQNSKTLTDPFAYAGLQILTAGATNWTTDTADASSKFYRLNPVTDGLPIPVISAQSDPDGATLVMNPGVMKLQVFAPGIIRVTYNISNSIPSWTNNFAVIAPPTNGVWPLTVANTDVRLDTGEIEVRVNRASGAVSFFDTNGVALLVEKPDGGKSLTPVLVNGVPTFASQQKFMIASNESFYGLGQHQNGVMNYAGSTVHLQQMNPGESAVPVLVSSLGYGILWDNPAISDVNLGANANSVAIPSTQLYTTNGQIGGLSGNYYSGMNFDTFLFSRTDSQINFNWTTIPPTNTMSLTNYSVEWDGSIQAEQAGTYIISVTTDDGVRLWIDNQEIVDDWSARAAKTYLSNFNWQSNSVHSVRMQYFQNEYDAVAQLNWSTPNISNPIASWTSQTASAINYYFIHGPELDDVVRNYRHLTGNVPMFGKWAWGYWQSKNAYNSQSELLSVIDQYRSSSIPIDCIVQDWLYWSPNPWGSDQFNSSNYPNVSELMQTLHNENAHMIISKWARFDVGNYTNYLQLSNAAVLYPQVIGNQYQFYDAFSPVGRALYWQQVSNDLFSLGIDGWWLDASEPELGGNWGVFTNYTTAAGPGASVFNAYPLLHSAGLYTGQRAADPSKRVFILTRSAYAGQQRNAAVTWSGDIDSTWPAFAEQIPAGLNFSISGIPYWNTDIGGYLDDNGSPTDPSYAELFTRWFQFGAFCPMFRVHGQNFGKEMWQFPPATEAILINYDQLRYHLLPYIYSVAWMVTSQGYSMMRPLVMDFRFDANVYNIPDQYMFGPAMMVNPVVQAGVTNRSVYLPTGKTWYDFWTGQTYAGGNINIAAASIGIMPLFVPAGSIIPYGPSIQYASQSVDPMELRIYRGASGSFTLYDDEGDNYNYESGSYATIPISWNDSTQTLTIGQRLGSFSGMPANRTFNIVWVSPNHGVGVASTPTADVVIPYSGQTVTIPFGH
jgi:alpha-D-xyloside xylohydrolase